jgi:hypothetical protein
VDWVVVFSSREKASVVGSDAEGASVSMRERGRMLAVRRR